MKLLKVVLASALVLLSVASLRAQSVDEIVSKHVDAIGGASAWEKINSVRMTATMTTQGTEVTAVLTGVRNKGFRTDIAVMGMNGYVFITPTEGWSYMPFQGQQKPEALTADRVKDAQDELDLQGELVDYQQKGNTVELTGKEDVEGTECWKLKVTLKSGKVKTEYIDPSSYYRIREVSKINVNGKVMDKTTDFSNYQKLPEGITVPMTLGTPQGELIVKKIEINPSVDPSIFKVQG